MGCFGGGGGGGCLKKVISIAAPVIGTALGGPLGGALGGAAGSALGGGNVGQDLLGAGLGGLGGALSGATGSLVTPDSLFSGANSGISSLFSPVTSAISDVGSSIGNGLSKFSDSSGLSSLFGGNAQDAQSLGSLADNVRNAPAAGANVAASAATPSASVANSALPSGVSAGSGGTIGGGLGDSGTSLGESVSAPSASGIGGAEAALPANATESSLASSAGFPIANAGQDAALTSQINAAPAASELTKSIGAGTGMGTSNSILGNLLSGGSSGGAGNQVMNGLLRSGLAGLFNNPNNAGFNAQINAGNQVQSDFQPFLQSGTAANNQLSALYGTGGDGAQAAAQANFQNTPGYQFALDQGTKAVNANAAKMGQTLSGNNQQAVQNYGTGLADQTYQSYIKNLQEQAGQGINAAGGVATGQAGVGNAMAGKSGASANNQNTAVGGALSSLFPQNGISFGANGLTNNNSGGLLSLLLGNSQPNYAP